MNGRALFSDTIAESVVLAVLPKDAQEEMLSAAHGQWMLNMMALRTAALDRLLEGAASQGVHKDVQIAFLGAGKLYVEFTRACTYT